MMTKTKEDFCRELLDDESPRETLDPERMAGRFVRYFKLSARPTLDQLSAMLSRAGFGEVSDREMDGLKGAHIGQPRGHYDIYYRQGLWDGSSTYTVLHETYEIINETLWDIHSGDTPDRMVCREADRFAAAVLMQPEAFSLFAEASGFDVLALQKQYRCSYAAVTIRLAEVLRDPPLMAVLYEREEKGDPAGWTETPALRATVARQDEGLRDAGLLPHLRRAGRSFPAGAGCSRTAPSRTRPPATARRSTPTTAAMPPSPDPSSGKGRLAKVVVVAVPDAGPRRARPPGGSPPTSWPAGAVRWRPVPW